MPFSRDGVPPVRDDGDDRRRSGAPRTWPIRLRNGVTAVLELFASRPAFIRLMLIEAPSSGKRGLEIYASGKRISQSLIDRGREDSPVAAVVPSSASAAALAATEALIVGGKILEGKTDQLADLVPDIFYIVTVQYRSRDEALQQFEMAGASR